MLLQGSFQDCHALEAMHWYDTPLPALPSAASFPMFLLLIGKAVTFQANIRKIVRFGQATLLTADVATA